VFVPGLADKVLLEAALMITIPDPPLPEGKVPLPEVPLDPAPPPPPVLAVPL
jgi:hypothetical protein